MDSVMKGLRSNAPRIFGVEPPLHYLKGFDAQIGLLQIMLVPKSKLLGIDVAELLQAGCPSCHPTSSIKTMKETQTDRENGKTWGDTHVHTCISVC